MANCPVDSMKGGGLSWFSDLTVADPYYILPLLTSATLFIQFKLGVEYGTKLSQSTGAGKAGRTLVLFCIILVNYPRRLITPRR